MSRNPQRALLLVTTSILLATSSPALAQTASSPLVPAAENQPVDATDIVVTAQKRSESVQRVPAAITALNSQLLQERGVTEVADLRFIAPSVEVNNLIGNTGVSIRGVGLNLLINNAAPAVAIHIDGVYQPIAAMGTLAQVDLERVEVLRGPQGTLYGRNANAGAINFISKAPTDKFEGYAQFGYASYNEARLQGVINVPISDGLKVRAVVDYQNRGKGFYQNVLPGGEDVIKGKALSGRVRITADLANNLTLDLMGAALRQTGPWQSYILRGVPTGAVLTGAIAPQEPWRTAVNDKVDLDRTFQFGAATLSWDIAGFQLKSITGWQRLHDEIYGDDDATNLSAFVVHRIYRSTTFTQEFNLNREIGPVKFVLGAFLLDDTYYSITDYSFPRGFPPLPPNSRLAYEQRKLHTVATAAFADATLNITNRFRIFGGVRISRDKLTNVQNNFLSAGGAPITVTCPPTEKGLEFKSTTPRAGAQFDISSASNVYATFSKGFKDGGFNRISCQQTYSPERITSYEGGLKNRFLNGKVMLNLSAFWYDYSDLQLNQQVGLGQIISNAAEAKVKGLELEAVWQPDRHWTFNINGTLLDATYTNFINVDPLNRAAGFQNLSGNTLNNSPKQSLNGGVSYRMDTEIGRFTLRADASYRSRIYFREFELPLDSQAPYSTLNLAVIWDSPKDRYRIRLYANNATKTAYITGMSSSEQLGARYATWGSPQQYGIELRANF